MPMDVTIQTLHDGGRIALMQVTGVSDGSNENRVVKVDTSVMVPKPKTLKITKLEYDVAGGIVELFWDADDPVKFTELTGIGSFDYSGISGMLNGGGPSATGNILLSTVGFDSGSSYQIKLSLKKKF